MGIEDTEAAATMARDKVAKAKNDSILLQVNILNPDGSYNELATKEEIDSFEAALDSIPSLYTDMKLKEALVKTEKYNMITMLPMLTLAIGDLVYHTKLNTIGKLAQHTDGTFYLQAASYQSDVINTADVEKLK